jgi:hypothetical protein
MHSPLKPKLKKKALLGPGAYNPYGDQFPKTPKLAKPLLTEKKILAAHFPKARKVSPVEQIVKYSAAVGKYDVRLPEERKRTASSKTAVPFTFKSKRFNESHKASPGPGTYEVLLPMSDDILPRGRKQ